MEATNRKQPTEEEIWELSDKNPVGEVWPERIITWNPREFYFHTIRDAYKSQSTFEWLFHFLQDKSFSKHKKERVLRILFRNKGREVRLISSQPLTFMVISQPESPRSGAAAHAYTVTLSWNGKIHCGCEWEQSTANSETCTHIISVRTYFHFLFRSYDGRKQQTPNIQGETEICAC